MTVKLPEGKWFVGPRSVPVTAEGRRVVHIFVGGVAVLVALSIVLALTVYPFWLWVPIFAIGMLGFAVYFLVPAKRHTDFSMTWQEYAKRKDA